MRFTSSLLLGYSVFLTCAAILFAAFLVAEIDGLLPLCFSGRQRDDVVTGRQILSPLGATSPTTSTGSGASGSSNHGIHHNQKPLIQNYCNLKRGDMLKDSFRIVTTSLLLPFLRTPAKSHAAPQEEYGAKLRYISKTNSVTRRQVNNENKRGRFCEVIELVEEVSPSVPDNFAFSQRNFLTFRANFTKGMGYLVESDVLIKPNSYMATKGYILTNGSFYTLSAGNPSGEATYEAVTGGTGQYEQATGTVTSYSPSAEFNSYSHLVDICYGPNS